MTNSHVLPQRELHVQCEFVKKHTGKISIFGIVRGSHVNTIAHVLTERDCVNPLKTMEKLVFLRFPQAFAHDITAHALKMTQNESQIPDKTIRALMKKQKYSETIQNM